MMMQEARETIVKVGKILFDFGMVQLSGGNISMRDPVTNLVAIKPSGVPYIDMKPEDIIIVDLNMNIIEGNSKPSIETPMHTGVYKARPDVNAIVHCHPSNAVAWSLKYNFIPNIIVSQYLTKGAISVAPYCESGSQELADTCVKSLGDNFAVLLKAHGILCCGPDMQYALETTLVTEDAAKVAFLSGQTKDIPCLKDNVNG